MQFEWISGIWTLSPWHFKWTKMGRFNKTHYHTCLQVQSRKLCVMVLRRL